MYTLSDGSAAEARAALDEIVAADAKRFIPVVIEMLMANQTEPSKDGAGANHHIAALNRLTGDPSLAPTNPRVAMFESYFRWYAENDLSPPEGFIGWKGSLLSRISPEYGEMFTDETVSRIRVEEICGGGVPFDGMPTLDRSETIEAAQAKFLKPDDVVFGLFLDGEARAYPEQILEWHEMTNDVVGKTPVSLAYCSLCGAAIAYDGRASDGNTYTFGTSGLLYRSNKLMFDRTTRTLWNQMNGRPVVGSLAATDVKLRSLPVVVTTWDDWKGQHPGTKVLSRNTGYDRRYRPGAAYATYFDSTETMFPPGKVDNRLALKEWVYGISIGETAKAYPIAQLAKEKVLNDDVGTHPVVLVALRGTLNVSTNVLMNKSGYARFNYKSGGEVRSYERGTKTFRLGPNENLLLDDDGTTWKITEEALVGENGDRLNRVTGTQAYWFGWTGFHERTDLWGLRQ
jgi:hypothetical protein